ncbi:sugar phosphate isomerase/epimerase family protein [Catenulispora rubra]|uniref:sugar phosphate isomerase/epimerase family protein n=1 Tax=Catenulispora rubra TaxID=280293 RepID=UPI0018925844|nr:sugar phosphate isomerase/epimerase [Catenulispora rubra]
MPRIGLQTMMLKESVSEVGAFDTLKKATEIGYSVFEISQIPLSAENVAQFNRARSELGVTVAAISALFTTPPGMTAASLTKDFDKIVEDAASLGTSTVRMPMPPLEAMTSTAGLIEFAEAADAMARRLARHDIELCYHNHHFDFARFDGVSQFDLIAKHAPSLTFEIDVHWAYRGGVDPARLIAEHASRVALVHLRDYRVDRIPPDAFASAASGDVPAMLAALAALVHDAEVGEGALDMAGIIEASLAANVGYLIVEQEDLLGRDPFDCVALSQRNLVELGYGRLF